jgi:WXG100 family type VII secretion target
VAGFAVDPDELAVGDADVARSCAQARGAVARLAATADDLFAGGWQGGAATSFRLGWQHWLCGAHEMLAALDGLAALLGSAATAYADTEAGVRADIARRQA